MSKLYIGLLALPLLIAGCHKAESLSLDGEAPGTDGNSDADGDVDADGDADTDSDTNSDQEHEDIPIGPPEGLWAVRGGSNGNDRIASLAVGSDGSTTVVGSCEDVAQLGDGDPTETLLTGGDSFMARYDDDGVLEWARIGCSGHCEFEDLALLDDGSFLVHGAYREAVTFGEGESGELTLVATPPYDMFVARFDPEGDLEWLSNIEVTAEEPDCMECYPRAIAAWADGSSVITGAIEGPQAVFAPGDPEETVLLNSTPAQMTAYLARFGASGQLSWVEEIEGSSCGRDVVTLAGGSCALAGVFGGTAVFGAGQPGETELTSISGTRVFLARLDTEGNLEWVVAGADMSGGGTSRGAQAIAARPDGSLVMTGLVAGGMGVFGAGEPNETWLYAPGFYDCHFVARFQPTGELDWAKAIGVAEPRRTSLALLDDGRVVVAAALEGQGLFAPEEDGEVMLETGWTGHSFLALYQPDGAFVSAELVARADDSHCPVAAAKGDYVVLGGAFDYAAVFWETEPYAITLHSAGDLDAFLARYRLSAD